jgi:hypothetical protein
MANEECRPTKEAAPKSMGRTDAEFIGSRSVSWWSVHEYVSPRLVDSWPMVGTPQWCALDDDDLVKIAAIFDAAQHWALWIECRQEAMTEASHDVSDAADWAGIAEEMKARQGVHIPRKVVTP